MSDGFIMLHRSIQKHWIYEEKRKFSRYEAWLDLLMMVNYKDNKILQDGKLVDVKRGERITSIRQLMDRWGWSNTKVVNYLELLQSDNMIEFEVTSKKKTLIKIVKYSQYQGIQHSEQSEEKTQKRQPEDTEATQNNINNKDNKANKENNIPFVEIVTYLNEKTASKFLPTANKTKDCIKARFNEGHTLEDFKTVIDYFVVEWKGKTWKNKEGKLMKGDDYLRPSTLFNNKFNERLNKALTSKPSNNKAVEFKEDMF
jgi:uncharacterized phage protein (TIGR02220 family)